MATWARLQGRPEVHRNRFTSEGADRIVDLASVLGMAAKGVECFDCEHYAAGLVADNQPANCSAQFTHFINYGQFSGMDARCVLRTVFVLRDTH